MAARGQRFDVFALPSDTDAYFALLIVSVIGSSILLFSLVFNSVPPLWAAKSATIEQCNVEVAQAVPGTDLARDPLRHEARALCERPMRLLQFAWDAGAVMLLSGLAAGLYWWLPRRTLRRGGFKPLRRADHPELVDEIDALAHELGVRPPSLVCNPLNRSGGGVAFGRWGRRYLGLYGGTLLRFRRDRAAFRSVVLHELAHLRNADLDKAALAVTVWWAFVAVAIVPTALAIMLGGNVTPLRVLDLSWRLALAAGVVIATRAAVLRERELFADQRAADWGAAGLGQAIGQLAPRRSARLPATLRRLVSLHPAPGLRIAALADPRPLFRFDPWTALTAGLTTTMAIQSVEQIAGFVGPASAASLFGASVLGPLLAAVVALGVWREEAYRQHAGLSWSVVPAVVLGAALGGGMVLGWRASVNDFGLQGSGLLTVDRARLIFEVGFLVLVLLSAVGFVAWLRTSARAWSPLARPAGLSERTALVAATLTASVLAVLWLAALSSTLGLAPALGALNLEALEPELGEVNLGGLSSESAVLALVFGASLWVITLHPLTSVALALLWAFPVLGMALQPHGADCLVWRASALTSGVFGVLGSIASVGVLLVTAQSGDVAALAVAGPVAFGVFQLGAGLLIALRAPALPTSQALMTAQLTGVVAAALVALLLAAGELGSPWELVGPSLNGGTLLAGIGLMLGAPLLSGRATRARR